MTHLFSFFQKGQTRGVTKVLPFLTHRCPGSALRVGRPSLSSCGAGGQEVGQAEFGVSRVPDWTLRHINQLPSELRGTQGRCPIGVGESEPPMPGRGPLQGRSAPEASSPRFHDSRPVGAWSLHQAVFLDPGPFSESGILERLAAQTRRSPAHCLRLAPRWPRPSASTLPQVPGRKCRETIVHPPGVVPRPTASRARTQARERGTHRARCVCGADAPSCGPPWPGRPVSRELGVNSPEWSTQACSQRRCRYPGPAGPELQAAQVRQPSARARGLPGQLRCPPV